MKWKLLLLWLLVALALRAQPGGGGGLDIGRLYGRQGSRLVPLDSAAVRLRLFVLADAAARAAYRAGRPYRPAYYPTVTPPGYGPAQPSYYPRSLFDTYHAVVQQEETGPDWQNRRRDFDQLRLPSHEPQRLLLVYQADTMVLDVSNLPHANGAGYRAHLDSLVVMPGYFGLSFQRRPAPGEAVLRVDDTLGFRQRQLGFALTPSRVAGLQRARNLDYRPAGRRGLPPLPDPAALRTLQQAYQQLYYSPGGARQALATLEAARAAGVPLADARTCLLQASCYQALQQPALAERWLTEVLRLTPSPSYQNYEASTDLGLLQAAYQQRQALRLRARRYPEALADYDSLAALRVGEYRASGRPYLEETLQQERAARLAFQTDSLHENGGYQATIRQLRADLEPNLATMWRCRLGGTGPDELHQLARAEYAVGELAAAYQHWQVLLLQGNLDPTYYVAYFTDLRKQHPDRPELLLCRALAYQCATPAEFSSQLDPPARDAALRDLEQAATRLPRDFRVHYFRARVYEQAGQLPQAVAEATRALALEATLPALYRFRHELRVKLKQVQEFDRADPDYARYADLCTGGR